MKIKLFKVLAIVSLVAVASIFALVGCNNAKTNGDSAKTSTTESAPASVAQSTPASTAQSAPASTVESTPASESTPAPESTVAPASEETSKSKGEESGEPAGSDVAPVSGSEETSKAGPEESGMPAPGGSDSAEAAESTSEAAVTEPFKATFVLGDNVTVKVYESEDLTGEGTVATEMTATANDGTGQFNFVLVFAEGYELDNIAATPTTNYNKLKGPADTGVENGYKVTKVTGDVTITVSAKAIGAEEDLTGAFKGTFVLDEHVTVTVYKSQNDTEGTPEATEAYARNSSSGTIDTTGNGQINFIVTVTEGYVIDEVTATEGSFKNLKNDPETDGSTNYYRITKITADLTITITTKPAEVSDEE